MAIKIKNKFGQWVSAENVPIVPSTLSQLINDSHFVKLLQLDELPEIGENDTLYVTPIFEEESPIGYSIYIWENNTWKNLSSGGTGDLSKYYTKNETDILLNNKVSVEEGKGLSTNDYTTEEKNKLATIESGATKVKNTSDIINDSGFINNNVDNLTNYYLKSQTYTKTEVDNLLEGVTKDTIQVVQTLPSTGESNIIYLVPKESSPTDNYDEYLWINNQWEHIGSTNKGDGIIVVNNTTEIDSLYTQFGICDLSLIWTGDDTLYTYYLDSPVGAVESMINLVPYELYSVSVNVYNDTQVLIFSDRGNIKGADGFSPTVSTTSVTGGTQVTITDKTSNHTFTVHDGSNADAETYTDNKCATTLSSAKTYTNNKLTANLINSATAIGTAKYVDFTTDSSGNAFSLREFTLFIGSMAASTTGSSQNLSVSIKTSGGSFINMFTITAANAVNMVYMRIHCHKELFWVAEAVVGTAYDTNATLTYSSIAKNAVSTMGIDKVDGIRVSVDNGVLNTSGDSIFLVGRA